MNNYMVLVKYTPAGLDAIRTEGFAARVAAGGAAVESLGGRMVSMLWLGLGEWDQVTIVELPSLASLQRMMATAGSSGTFARWQTYETLDGASMDAAMSGSISWRPPGG